MASQQQQHKTAVVAVFLATLVLALPAAAYGPDASGYAAGAAAGTPAESTPTEAAEVATPAADGYSPGAAASTPAEAAPTEAAVSTPTKPGTPAEATPTDSTPAEATPTEAAATTPVADGYKPGAAAATTPAEPTPTDSTPAEATPADSAPAEATPTDSTPAESGTPVAPGYTPAAAAATTTPATDSAKATTDVQKLMEMVNGAYKKALEAANSAPPNDKYAVFAAALNKACTEGVADRPTMKQRGTFTEMINSAVRDAYSFTSTTLPADQRFSVFISSLTEALRVMAASMDVHAVKPAAEEAIAGGVNKEPTGDSLVIGKIDAAVKAAAGAAKEARLNEKYIVFRAAFSNALKNTIGAVCDEKTIPQLSFAYRQVYQAIFANTPEKRFTAFIFGLSEYIKGVAIATNKAAQAAANTKPVTQPVAQDTANTKPPADAAYKPAPEEAAAKPAPEEAAAKPAPETDAKPAGGAGGGYNL